MENRNPPHNKFYKIEIRRVAESGVTTGYKIITSYGRIGTRGTQREQSHWRNASDADYSANNLWRAKQSGGYRVISDEGDTTETSVRTVEEIIRTQPGHQQRHIRRIGGRAYLAGRARITAKEIQIRDGKITNLDQLRPAMSEQESASEARLRQWEEKERMRTTILQSPPPIKLLRATEYIRTFDETRRTEVQAEIKTWMLQNLRNYSVPEEVPSDEENTYITGGEFNWVYVITTSDGSRIGSLTFERVQGQLKRLFMIPTHNSNPDYYKKAVATLEKFIKDETAFRGYSGTQRNYLYIKVNDSNAMMTEIFKDLGYVKENLRGGIATYRYSLVRPSVGQETRQRYYFDEKV